MRRGDRIFVMGHHQKILVPPHKQTAPVLVKNDSSLKDVLMGIPKRDLLGMTVAVLYAAGY